MNKKTISMEKKIINSKFKISQNLFKSLIVFAVIFLVGLIVTCTVGFNLGTDFSGSSSFKIFVNSEAKLENATVYDLQDVEDYNTVYGKVQSVLTKKGLKIVSYRTSSLKITELNEPDAQAIEVVFQNSTTNQDKINEENQAIREAIIAEFDYTSFESGVTSVDFSPAQSSFDWMIGLLASIVFGLLVAMIYMMFKFDKSSWIMILQVALDIVLFLALLSIVRLTVNLTVGITILATFVLSMLNGFIFYAKMKENISSGKYTGMKNNEMADTTIKSYLFKKILAYVVMIILSFILAIIAVEAVREVALGLVIALVSTFFTSTFMTPAFWAVVYKEKRKKQTQQK